MTDLHQSARIMSLLDSLAALEHTTSTYLSAATFPDAERVLRLWFGAQDPSLFYLDERASKYGRMLDLRRKHDHQSVVTVATLDATVQAQVDALGGGA